MAKPEKVGHPPESKVKKPSGHTKEDWWADAAEEAFKL